jgi:hypothetical protein
MGAPELRDFPRWLEEAPIGHPDHDRLGFRVPAERLASSLRAAHPTRNADKPERRASFVFTIEAPWGSGKTSFGNLVASYLNEPNSSPTGTESWSSPVLVDFSAWQSVSMGLTPWEALAYRIGEAFYRRLHRLCLEIGHHDKGHLLGTLQIGNPRHFLAAPSKAEEPLIDVRDEHLRSARWFGEPRIHWLEVAVRLAQAVESQYWDPCLKIFVDASSKLVGRELGHDEGIESLAGLFGGALSVATGDAKGAVSSVTKATRTLLRRRLLEGPEWGVDTREFARALDRLIYVLHPRPRHWRAFVVIDDVARLPEEKLPSILEAATHLRELHDIAVAIAVPPRVVESLQRIHAPGVPRADEHPPDGESFLAKLIHVRFPLPKPDDADLSRMMAEALGDLNVSTTIASNVVRHFLSQRTATPRQMKQALQWLWFRFLSSPGFAAPVCREALAGDFDQEMLEWMLILLLDLHLHTQHRTLDNIRFQDLQERRRMFLYYSVQPWDLRDWRDRFGCAWAAWKSDFPESLDLLAAIRLHDLLVEYDHPQEASAVEAGQRAWRAWQLRLGQADEFDLSEELLRATPQDLWNHLMSRLDHDFPDRLFERAQLASTARYHHFAGDEPRLGEPETFARMARFVYLDADVLWRLANGQGTAPETAAKAWILLSFVAPSLARRHGDSLKRNVQTAKLVPIGALQELQRGLEVIQRQQLADGRSTTASSERPER